MTKNQKLTLNFAWEKETPGTMRYKEVDDKGFAISAQNIKVGTLYIKKSALGSDAPMRLEVQITAQ